MRHTHLLRPLLAFVTLLLLTLSCGKRTPGELKLTIDLRDTTPAPHYLYTYGTTRITRDTLPAGSTFSLEYLRDTVDLFILTDTLGHTLLPFIPDTTDTSITLGPTLRLKGTGHTPQLAEWYRLTHERDTLSTELLDLLQQHITEPITLPMTMGVVERFGETPELRQIFTQLGYNQREYLKLLGWQDYRMDPLRTFPHTLAVNDDKDSPRTLSGVIRKDSLLVTCILDGSRLSPADTTLLQALDTLTRAHYFVLPLADSIPSYWSKQLPDGRTYTLLDSIGAATEELLRLHVTDLPTYLVVDSFGYIRHQSHDQDALLSFLKTYKNPQH